MAIPRGPPPFSEVEASFPWAATAKAEYLEVKAGRRLRVIRFWLGADQPMERCIEKLISISRQWALMDAVFLEYKDVFVPPAFVPGSPDEDEARSTHGAKMLRWHAGLQCEKYFGDLRSSYKDYSLDHQETSPDDFSPERPPSAAPDR